MNNNNENKLLESKNDFSSLKSAESNLIGLFHDAIITDTWFRVIDISNSVLSLLGYRKEQIANKTLNEFIVGEEEILNDLLHRDSFSNIEFSFKNNEGYGVQLFLSGFRLNIKNELNGRIVLLVKNSRSALLDKKRYERRLRFINQVIYRTSHDIRGPLSTIQGLTSLGLVENSNTRALEYLKLISEVVNQLDLKLQYLKESVNRENYQITRIKFKDYLPVITERLNKFSQAYKINLKITESGNLNNTLCTNPLLVSIFLENFLIMVDSISEIKGTSYSIHLSYVDHIFRIRIINTNLALRYQQFFGQVFSFRGLKELLNKDGYNTLVLRTLKICQEKIKAKTIPAAMNPSEILLEIPSKS